MLIDYIQIKQIISCFIDAFDITLRYCNACNAISTIRRWKCQFFAFYTIPGCYPITLTVTLTYSVSQILYFSKDNFNIILAFDDSIIISTNNHAIHVFSLDIHHHYWVPSLLGINKNVLAVTNNIYIYLIFRYNFDQLCVVISCNVMLCRPTTVFHIQVVQCNIGMNYLIWYISYQTK